MKSTGLEKELRKSSPKNSYYLPIMQANQDYLYNYHQKTSLYHFEYTNNNTNLYIYNTENESKEIKILETPIPLDWRTCLAQFPNGKLFCLSAHSKIIQIIDKNGEIRVLSQQLYISNKISIALEDLIAMALLKLNLLDLIWIWITEVY